MIRISIRLKILLLVTGGLSLSLGSYVYLGSSLIVQDKSSYIYDYGFSRLKASSDALSNRLKNIKIAASVLVALGNADGATYEHYIQDLDVEGLVLLKPMTPSIFEKDRAFGNAPLAMAALAMLSWTPQRYEEREVIIGAPYSGFLPIGGKILDPRMRPVGFFALVRLKPEILAESGTKGEQTVLLGQSGRTLLGPSGFESLAQELPTGKQSAGVRAQQLGGREYILSYRRFLSDQLLMISLIPKEVAFYAAQDLLNRSIALGIFIFALAFGFTLIFIRSVTGRLRQMWYATQKVIEGDFSVRVKNFPRAEDELSGLSRSFNAMADKIDALMKETAQKARMEKELEMARTIQAQFLPRSEFENPAFRLAGQLIPASECGGDWWNYFEVGNHLFVIVGDVTGHGVSAALVTSAVYTATSFFTHRLKGSVKRDPSSFDVNRTLHGLLWELNTAILLAAGEKALMTCIVSAVNLQTGTMTTANASHRHPYVCRKEDGLRTSVFAVVSPIIHSPLGQSVDLAQIEVSTLQLKPGDLIFWYTDGLIEMNDAQGAPLRKSVMIDLIQKHGTKTRGDVHRLGEELVAELFGLMGGKTKNPPDDVTLAIGVFEPAVEVEVSKKIAS